MAKAAVWTKAQSLVLLDKVQCPMKIDVYVKNESSDILAERI